MSPWSGAGISIPAGKFLPTHPCHHLCLLCQHYFKKETESVSSVNRLQNDSDGKFLDRAAAKDGALGALEGMTKDPKRGED